MQDVRQDGRGVLADVEVATAFHHAHETRANVTFRGKPSVRFSFPLRLYGVPKFVQHPDRTDPQKGDEKQALLQREKRAISKAQAGELAALEPVLAFHAEALFMGILGRVGERAQAEDILKDTFVTALEKISTYTQRDQSLYPWLRQIAFRKVIDYHRAQGRRKRLCQALRAELQEGIEPSAPALLSAEEERTIARERIAETLRHLHPRYATVIRLRLGEEKPRAVCAAELQVSVETFDVLLLRAVRAFRKAYGEPDAG